MTTISAFTRAPETGQHAAVGIGVDPSLVDSEGNPNYAAIRVDPDFVRLRNSLTRFVLVAGAAFVLWYLTYVLLAAYAHEFMSQRVFGSITVGLLLGLSQFVTTVLIMLLYVRFSRKKLDPQVAVLRLRAGAGRS